MVVSTEIAFLAVLAAVPWPIIMYILRSQNKRKLTEDELRQNILHNGPLSPEGLENIAHHQYKSAGWTKVDLALDKWWSFVAKHMPDSVAPNVVTLLGCASVLVTTFLTFYFEPNPQAERPKWIGICAVISMFLYQTFDAVDGKHARRTGQSSPLGQLFDHGIDGFTLTIATYNVAAGRGLTPLQFYIMFTVGHISYYCAQWSERHTHVLATNFGVLGVTEVQIISSLLGVTTYIIPYGQWSEPMSLVFPSVYKTIYSAVAAFVPTYVSSFVTFLFSFSLHHLIVGFVICSNVWIVYCQTKQVVTYYFGMTSRSETWRGLFRAAAELLPLVGFVIIHYLWKSTPMVADHPILYVITIAFLFSHLNNQVIVTGMAHDYFAWFQPVLIPFALVAVADRFYSDVISEFNRALIATALCMFVVFVQLRWAMRACQQIATRLNIYVLKPGRPYTDEWKPLK